VGPLGIIEVQGARESVDDRVAGVGRLPLLEAGVVVDGDTGDLGQLFAPQPWDAAWSPDGDPGVLGCDGVPPAAEEVA
jgi:hypothetical protein